MHGLWTVPTTRSVPDASKCNRAYKAVYCNTEPGWDNCQWVADQEHQVQDDCNEPKQHSFTFPSSRQYVGNVLKTEISVMSVAAVIAAAFIMQALYRCWSKRAAKAKEARAKQVEMSNSSTSYYQAA